MKLTHIALSALCAASIALLSSCSKKNDNVVIKFTSVTTQDSPKGKSIELFKKLVEERSQGKIKVETYHNSTLYKDKEETEALQNGAVQMAAISLAKFGPMNIKEFELFDLPYVFNDFNDVHKVTQGPVGAEMMKLVEPKGLQALGFWDNGMKLMSANKPLKTPADYQGLKMRIQSSKVIEEQMRALGSLPQVMPFSETYQALSTGVVDGTENPPSNMWTQKMHEVQKHATLTNHGILAYMVVANKKFWDGLTPEQHAIIDPALKEATDYANKIAQEENEQSLGKIKESGKTTIYTPTAEERLALKKAMLPSHAQADARVGGGWMQKIYTAVGFDANK
ncbi:MAG: DctP family TRAP transporter solute-binding subunit [Formosimonas sp.]